MEPPESGLVHKFDESKDINDLILWIHTNLKEEVYLESISSAQCIEIQRMIRDCGGDSFSSSMIVQMINHNLLFVRSDPEIPHPNELSLELIYGLCLAHLPITKIQEKAPYLFCLMCMVPFTCKEEFPEFVTIKFKMNNHS